jgi:hypothetical protein
MTYFRLPDDFSGGISDALRLMADYHDEVTGGGLKSLSNKVICRPMPSLNSTLSEAFGLTFDEFIDAVQDDKRLSGILRLRDFDPKVKISHL